VVQVPRERIVVVDEQNAHGTKVGKP
jgi:hypothetical protein